MPPPLKIIAHNRYLFLAWFNTLLVAAVGIFIFMHHNRAMRSTFVTKNISFNLLFKVVSHKH